MENDIVSLNIKILMDGYKDPIDFTLDNLVLSKPISAKKPFFYSKYAYKDTAVPFKNLTLSDICDETKMTTIMNATQINTEKPKGKLDTRTMDANMLTTLSLLFPDFYDNDDKERIFTSYDDFAYDLTRRRLLQVPPTLPSTEKTRYQLLQVNGKYFLPIQIGWLNDIRCHPVYKSMFDSIMMLMQWYADKDQWYSENDPNSIFSKTMKAVQLFNSDTRLHDNIKNLLESISEQYNIIYKSGINIWIDFQNDYENTMKLVKDDKENLQKKQESIIEIKNKIMNALDDFTIKLDDRKHSVALKTSSKLKEKLENKLFYNMEVLYKCLKIVEEKQIVFQEESDNEDKNKKIKNDAVNILKSFKPYKNFLNSLQNFREKVGKTSNPALNILVSNFIKNKEVNPSLNDYAKFINTTYYKQKLSLNASEKQNIHDIKNSIKSNTEKREMFYVGLTHKDNKEEEMDVYLSMKAVEIPADRIYDTKWIQEKTCPLKNEFLGNHLLQLILRYFQGRKFERLYDNSILTLPQEADKEVNKEDKKNEDKKDKEDNKDKEDANEQRLETNPLRPAETVGGYSKKKKKTKRSRCTKKKRQN